MHFVNQRDCVGDAFIPAGLAPCALAGFLAFLVRIVAPDVMYLVQSADLCEESGIRLVVAFAIVDGAGPVVAPLDHGTGFKSVSTHFVDVCAFAWLRDGPVAEVQQVLQVAVSQEASTFDSKLDVVLKRRKSVESESSSFQNPYGVFSPLFFSQVDLLEASSVPPDVHKLIQVTDLH